jgi:hypothetical protein
LTPIEVEFAFPPIGYLSAPVRRAMGWATPDQAPLDAGATRAGNPNRSPLHGGGRIDNPYLSIRPATKAPS